MGEAKARWLLGVLLLVGSACAARPRTLPDSPRPEPPGSAMTDRFRWEMDGDLATLDAWLAGRTFVDARDRRGQTLLHNTIAWGHLEAARRLIAHGAEVDALDADGLTPLDLAAFAGDVAAIDLLVEAGARVSPGDDGGRNRTPLESAAVYGHLDAVDRLLALGASVVDEAGGSAALDAAMAAGHHAVIARLLERGAPPLHGEFPGLGFVGARGDLETVRLLLDAGAARAPDHRLAWALSNVAEEGPTEVLAVMLDHGVPVDLRDHIQRTALFQAVWARRLDAVRLLLERGADVNAVDRDGWTPLDQAVLQFEVEHREIALVLVRAGARGEALRRLLAEAVKHAHVELVHEVVSVLLRDGDDGSALEAVLAGAAEARPPDGRTLLSLVLTRGVRLPADPDRLRGIMLQAIRLGDEQLAARALFAGARLVQGSEDDWGFEASAPLAGAMRHRMRWLAQELIRRGVPPPTESYDGSTALHRAAGAGMRSLVLAELARGADENALDDLGAAPLDWAARAGAVDVLEALVAHGAVCQPRGALYGSDGDDDYAGAMAAASGEGHLAAVRFLVERCGLAVTATSPELDDLPSPVDAAVLGDRADVVAYQLAHGVELAPGSIVEAARAGAAAVVELLAARASGPDELGDALVAAVANRDVAMTERLIALGAPVDHGAGTGEETALMSAAGADPHLVELLLSRGADPDPPCWEGRTPLTRAVLSYQSEPIAALLDAAQVDRVDCHGDAPLDLAAADEQIASRWLEPILAHGGGRRTPAPGRSALIDAVRGGRRWVARTLIEAGVDVSTALDDGTTPLLAALEANDLELAGLLLARGDDPALACPRSGRALALALARQAWDVSAAIAERCPRFAATDRDALLRLAAAGAQRTLIDRLLTEGADPLAPDEVGVTALHLAAAAGHPDVIARLTTGNPDVRDRRGATPLHVAAAADAAAVVAALLARGAAVDAADHDGNRALHLAAAGGFSGTSRLLIAAGANPREGDADGETPMHLAAASGDAATVEVLLAVGAPIAAARDGGTPLHRAVGEGSPSVVRALLAAGADPEAKDAHGWSPLIAAVLAGSTEVIEVLAPEVEPAALEPALRIALDNHDAAMSHPLVRAGATCERPLEQLGAACVEAALATGDLALAAAVATAPGASAERATDGWPVLHHTLRAGASAVALALIAAGARVDEEAAPPLLSPQTPLTLAVRGRHLDVIAALVAAGADPDRALSDGTTARRLADELGDPAVARALVRAGGSR